MRNNPQQAREFRHHSENAHGLCPPMSESSLSSQGKLIAQPLIEDVIEENHASIHIEASFIVK